MRTQKIQSSTDKCIFCYHQTNIQQLLPACDYCRAHSNQIAGHSSDNKTELSTSRKVGEAAKDLIGGSKTEFEL